MYKMKETLELSNDLRFFLPFIIESKQKIFSSVTSKLYVAENRQSCPLGKKGSRVCILSELEKKKKRKKQVALICLYLAVRNTDPMGLGEFILLIGYSISSNTTELKN